VKAFGQAGGTAATADQTLTGRFWNGPIQNYWNEITQTARLFALLDLTFADAVIAFYDAKYTYKLWRPITAIRAADTDGSFGVTSEVLPGVTRSFSAFSDAANEASLSRVFAGVHYRTDLTTGRRLGRHVASYVLEHFLTRVERDDDDD